MVWEMNINKLSEILETVEFLVCHCFMFFAQSLAGFFTVQEFLSLFPFKYTFFCRF